MSAWPVSPFPLVPARGRDYKSIAAVRADWDANKDFQSALSGRAASRDSFEPGEMITIRYAGLRKVTRFPNPPKDK